MQAHVYLRTDLVYVTQLSRRGPISGSAAHATRRELRYAHASRVPFRERHTIASLHWQHYCHWSPARAPQNPEMTPSPTRGTREVQ